MVLQLVRGLSAEFDTTAQLIHSQQADWDTARTMLNDEVIRLEARKQQSSSVLYTPAPTNHTTNQQPPAHSSENNQQQQQPPSYRGRGRGRGQGYRGRGGRGRGNRGQPPPTPWNFLNYTGQQQQFPQWAWWSTPPCPYPTQNTWKPNPTPQHPSANFAGQPHPTPPPYGHSPSGFDALSPSDLSAAFQTMQLQYQDPNAVMDTGAEQHATENRGMIPNLNSNVNTKLMVGNGELIPIEGSGTGYLPIYNRTYILPNILYTPKIIKTLISVRRFTRDNHVSIEFDPFGFSLKDLTTGRLLSRHNSTGNLYPITPPTLPPQACFLASTTLPWHDRLGHPGTQVLDVLSRRFGFSCTHNKVSNLCHSCQLANSKRLPFFESSSFTFAPFDIIHCDLWTSPITSKTGYKYYMVLVDNFSNFIWVYPLKYKSETFPTFAKFHKLIATQFNRNIKTFQCDLGGEFDNNAFKQFAHQHGLLFRFACPQTSSQNGRAERMIRRLNDIIRSLLIHAHLPPIFWVEALHTATYLHNILPTKRLNYYTPTFALYLRHPTYDHLRVFGCACYPNTSATQPHKLHPRSVRCIFLGYPPDFRGYRCFDPTTGKVSISRHMIFLPVSPFLHPFPPSRRHLHTPHLLILSITPDALNPTLLPKISSPYQPPYSTIPAVLSPTRLSKISSTKPPPFRPTGQLHRSPSSPPTLSRPSLFPTHLPHLTRNLLKPYTDPRLPLL
ncbi:putative RNA-directed DNA polymerase [Helianthus anomalus]